MLFSSLIFVWFFLPIVFIGNYLIRKIGRQGGNAAENVFLLIASLFFYAWGEPVYVLLMLMSIFLNWSAGMFLLDNGEGGSNSWRRRVVLIGAAVLNLVLLGYFKYAGFFVDFCNHISGREMPVPEIALPIGISFFTFQALSYVIDVYRGDCAVQKNPLKLALYISFFPQLIAGPIVKYRDIAEQIDHRTVSLKQTVWGIRRFIYGLSKKVLISNVMAACADSIYDHGISDMTSAMALAASLCYTMQIYYDFSGYSDMAIGLGKMFGFEFKENFNYPYISGSIREFWRRWHISLSTWFREYVYIPLGGNRKGKIKTYRNLLTVFFLTGLWHGAGYNFIFWGLFHGAFLVLERALYGKKLEQRKIIGWIYTAVIVNTGWIFFRVTDMRQAMEVVKRLVLPWRYLSGSCSILEFVSPMTVAVFILAVIGMGPVQNMKRISMVLKKMRGSWFEILTLTILFLLCLANLASGTYNPFIYFRF